MATDFRFSSYRHCADFGADFERIRVAIPSNQFRIQIVKIHQTFTGSFAQYPNIATWYIIEAYFKASNVQLVAISGNELQFSGN